jgi:serine/threonine protein phosphatase PrpC
MVLMLAVGRGDAMNTESKGNEQTKREPGVKKRLERSISRFFQDKVFFVLPNYENIVTFSEDEKAQDIFYGFTLEIQALWEKKFPGKILELFQNKRSEIKSMEFKDFSQEKSTDSMASPTAGAKNSPPSTLLTTASSERQDSKLPSVILKPGETPPSGIPPRKMPEPRPPVFFLPNCKVGVAYLAKIEGKDESGKPVHVLDIRSLGDYGLTFDAKTQIVSGEPKKDGEIELALLWAYEGSEKKSSGQCKLISNPNPRDLWKVNEPRSELPYKKDHLDQKLIPGKDYSIVAASRRGRSHEHNGSFRDDDFFIADLPEKGWSVLIVADGAGSARNSREGSRLATQTAGDHMVSALSGEFGEKISTLLASWETKQAQDEIWKEFYLFFQNTALGAIQAIEQEAQGKNIAAKDYATTLLAAALKREGGVTFLATFWIGDGAIAAYGPRGKVRLMGEPDGGEFAGQTRFLDRNTLADQDFGKRVRIGRWPDISAVLLMTDGVSDPRFETDNGLGNPEKWDALSDEITPMLNDPEPDKKLVEWLHFFKEGHHDDRTIALLW